MWRDPVFSRSTWGSAQSKDWRWHFSIYFSQLKTQHYQVTMLWQRHCGQLKGWFRVTGKFSPMKFLVNLCLEKKKHCQNLSNLKSFPPRTQRYHFFKSLRSSSSLPLGDRDRGDRNDRGVSKDGVFALAALQNCCKHMQKRFPRDWSLYYSPYTQWMIVYDSLNI